MSGCLRSAAPDTSSTAAATALPTSSSANPAYRVIDETTSSYRRPPPSIELVTVRDRTVWQGLWSEHTAGLRPALPLPTVDFGTQMVLGIFDVPGASRLAVSRIDVTAAGVRLRIHKETFEHCPGLAVIQHSALLIATVRWTAPVSMEVDLTAGKCS
jgi:hypothetical protein